MEIEKKLHRKLEIRAIFSYKTVEKQARYLEEHEKNKAELLTNLNWPKEKTNKKLNLTLVEYQTQGERYPIFALPPLSGDTHPYRFMSQLFGSEQPFYGLQLEPYKQKKLSLEHTIENMVKTIKRIQKKGPYFLLGYSAGGIFAHKLAEYFEKNKEQVGFLGLIDGDTGVYDQKQKNETKGFFIPTLARLFLENIFGPNNVINQDEFARLAVKKRFAYLLDTIRSADIPNDDKENLKITMESFFNRSIHCLELITKPKLHKINANTFLYLAKNNPVNTVNIAEQWKTYHDEDKLKIISVEGDHFSIMQRPHVEYLVKQISKELKNIHFSFFVRE